MVDLQAAVDGAVAGVVCGVEVAGVVAGVVAGGLPGVGLAGVVVEARKMMQLVTESQQQNVPEACRTEMTSLLVNLFTPCGLVMVDAMEIQLRGVFEKTK